MFFNHDQITAFYNRFSAELMKIYEAHDNDEDVSLPQDLKDFIIRQTSRHCSCIEILMYYFSQKNKLSVENMVNLATSLFIKRNWYGDVVMSETDDGELMAFRDHYNMMITAFYLHPKTKGRFSPGASVKVFKTVPGIEHSGLNGHLTWRNCDDETVNVIVMKEKLANLARDLYYHYRYIEFIRKIRRAAKKFISYKANEDRAKILTCRGKLRSGYLPPDVAHIIADIMNATSS